MTGEGVQFTWTAEESAFRQEVRQWLRANVPVPSISAYASTAEAMGPLRAWERKLAEANYNAVSWPVEYGGQGMDAIHATIFYEEYFRAEAPRRINYPGLGLLGPTLMAVGTVEQQRALIPRILSCADIWCQGFSEPEAGSDLASLRTTARRDGDVYIVNGQKTWSSNGPRANMMFALVRTDPLAPKHHGISYLLVDLASPGVEVRPIRQVNGASLFAEVFLRDVAVPAANLVGHENEGWQVANRTLTIERNPTESPPQLFRTVFDELAAVVSSGTGEPVANWAELARLEALTDCYRWNYYASATSDRVKDIGKLNSIAKLRGSTLQATLYETALRYLGDSAERGAAGLPSFLPRDFHERYWHARASLIYAGTNEIQRNMISERILGLPREPRG
jgi:alkylation response protein AidB-like acyl-CoA dehydrogenase